MDASRWDLEMLAFQRETEALAAKHPPVKLEPPFGAQRAVNDMLSMWAAAGGPIPAETTDRWIPAEGRRVFCRVYRPRIDKPTAVLIYFHGGGWVWSSVDTHDRIARELSAATQVSVVSVDYSLSPEAKFPRALNECIAAIGYIARHGAEWGLDTSQILLAGDSAGGNLALAAALQLRDQGGPALKGIMLAYPVCDSNFETSTYREFAAGYGLTRDRMAAFWNLYVERPQDLRHPLAAPLNAELGGLPPVLILLAELDVLRSEGEALAAKLRRSGVETEVGVFEGVIHGFLRACGTVTKAQDALRRAGVWMTQTLARGAPPT
jgi:acetyl esterase